jgi:hypothetical protein
MFLFRIVRKTLLDQVATSVHQDTMVIQQMGYLVDHVNVRVLIGIMQVTLNMMMKKIGNMVKGKINVHLI